MYEKEAREGLIRWPKLEVRKLITYIDSIKLESEIALSAHEEAMEYTRIEEKASVGQVCSMLNRLRRAVRMPRRSSIKRRPCRMRIIMH